MKLVVGLGNPGNEYKATRHNIGFMIIDHYLKTRNIEGSNNKFSGIYFEKIINDEKVILLKPQKYMNLSGEVVAQFVNFFKVPVEDILIIHDDLDILFGNVKLKYKGSCGGHNGLRNIEQHLHTQEYKRLKFGIGNKDVSSLFEIKDYVLSKFSVDEAKQIEQLLSKTDEIIDDYLTLTFDNLMNKYN